MRFNLCVPLQTLAISSASLHRAVPTNLPFLASLPAWTVLGLSVLPTESPAWTRIAHPPAALVPILTAVNAEVQQALGKAGAGF